MTLSATSWPFRFAAILVGIAGVVVTAACSDSAPRPEVFNITPTPTILPKGGNVLPVLEKLRAERPEQVATVDDWLTGDVEAAGATFPTVTGKCDDFITRGVSLCERAGYEPGTSVTLLIPSRESARGYQVEPQAVRDQIAYLVDGRNPRLDLLAQRDDGTLLAVIGLDAAPGKLFPGGTATNEAPVIAAYLYVAPDGTISDMSERGAGSPPLEPIRNDERQGVHTYKVLTASAEFVEWDKTLNDALDAARKASPKKQ